jgi:hypothetical protein
MNEVTSGDSQVPVAPAGAERQERPWTARLAPEETLPPTTLALLQRNIDEQVDRRVQQHLATTRTRSSLSKKGEPHTVDFTIYELATMHPIGVTTLDQIDHFDRTAVFGILIGLIWRSLTLPRPP